MSIYGKFKVGDGISFKLQHFYLITKHSLVNIRRTSSYNATYVRPCDGVFMVANVRSHLATQMAVPSSIRRGAAFETLHAISSRLINGSAAGIGTDSAGAAYKQAVLDAKSVEEAKELISELVAKEARLLLIKGTPDAPMCGFSAQVLRIMGLRRVDYTFVNVLSNDYVRQGAKEFANWPTFPQVYEDGEFVGGCEVLTQMYSNFFE